MLISRRGSRFVCLCGWVGGWVGGWVEEEEEEEEEETAGKKEEWIDL